jgi:copper(I)-binding protein
MSMVPVENGIALDPGATVDLMPGGYHLMLFEPVEPLRVGMRFTVTLELEQNGEIPVEIEVRR